MDAGEYYDAVFVGGGLAATLLLHGLRGAFPERVLVVDPEPPLEGPPVHWSYWSRVPTPYDRLSIGAWRRARVMGAPPQEISPFTLRLVRSTDVFASLEGALEGLPIERRRVAARSVRLLPGGLYEVATGEGTVRARWVFDSAHGVAPRFPSRDRPRAVLSGTGLRVEADGPAFDDGVATLFDPLDERSFAYLLPLSATAALIESASFGPRGMGEDREHLLGYLRVRRMLVLDCVRRKVDPEVEPRTDGQRATQAAQVTTGERAAHSLRIHIATFFHGPRSDREEGSDAATTARPPIFDPGGAWPREGARGQLPFQELMKVNHPAPLSRV